MLKIEADDSSVNSPWLISKYISSWDRTASDITDTVVIADNRLDAIERIKYKKSIAWLTSSPAYRSDLRPDYHWCKYDKILTFDRRILEAHSHAHLFPLGGSWLRSTDICIGVKDKLVSSIHSRKNKSPNQVLRLKIADDLKYCIDNFGPVANNQIRYKADALQPYAFSLAVENCCQDYYFSEKLTDCFATGTIPIYYGCPSIGKFFNLDGMIIIRSYEHAIEIIPTLTFKHYYDRIEAVKDNYTRVLQYLIPEDYGMSNNLFQ